MIVYPKNWLRNYAVYGEDAKYGNDISECEFVDVLAKILKNIQVKNLAYSGGLDSSVLLCLMSNIFENDCNTYIISCRKDHPDIIYAELGSEYYNAKHHETIVEPGDEGSIVKQFFENISVLQIICGDALDEFMCGYYEHQKNRSKLLTYKYFLIRLLQEHLIPLDKNSNSTKVYLPYIDEDLIDIMIKIPLRQKIDFRNRKKFMIRVARYLEIPKEIINRNKYAFSDAFLTHDK